jgi:hypothetical protein
MNCLETLASILMISVALMFVVAIIYVIWSDYQDRKSFGVSVPTRLDGRPPRPSKPNPEEHV